MLDTCLYYSLPGSSDYQFYRPSVSPRKGIPFCFVPFDRTGEKIMINLEQSPEIPHHRSVQVSAPEYGYEQKNYELLIERTKAILTEKAWEKVVIARPQTYRVAGLDAISLFHKLRKTYVKACVYLFSHPRCGTWLGATPELLLSGEAGRLESMSLAGTRSRGDKDSFTAKEEEEQGIVTRFIRELWEREPALDRIQVSPRETMAAGHLIHFKNRITARYNSGFNLDDLLGKMHPTPAVGGMPRQPALDFIRDIEQFPREFYSGYFGFRSGNSFAFYVNLRCMKIYREAAVLYAGGGILAHSDPAGEWRETQAKMQTLLRVIE